MVLKAMLCVSCFNREREQVVGRNARGTKPQPRLIKALVRRDGHVVALPMGKKGSLVGPSFEMTRAYRKRGGSNLFLNEVTWRLREQNRRDIDAGNVGVLQQGELVVELEREPLPEGHVGPKFDTAFIIVGADHPGLFERLRLGATGSVGLPDESPAEEPPRSNERDPSR